MTPDAKLQIFAIKRGMIKTRMDVNYYLPEYQNGIEKLKKAHSGKLRKISDFADVVCGPFGSAIKNGDYQSAGIPLLRITNISDDGNLDYKNIKFISKKLSDKLEKTQVTKGDIVVSQRGSLGLFAIIDDLYPIFNISANLIAIKNIKDHDPEFIRNNLNSTICKKFLEQAQSGQIQSKITTADISNILVPENFDEKKLNRIIDDGFYIHQQKLQQAEELLAGMDEFVLDTLGIKIPSQSDILCWAIRLGMLKQANTFSPEYFNHERLAVIKTLKQSSIPIFSLEEKVNFQRDLIDTTTSGHKFLGLASIQSDTGERVELEEQVTGNAFKYNIQDVLYCRLRPYLNKVYFAETSGVCSTEFHVMRPKDDSILPEYLAIIMRSKLTLLQTKHMMTGNTHPRISDEDVKALVIPVPSKKVQQKIVDEHKIRTSRARQLRQEAEKEWQDAREQFEKELLGE